MIVIGVDPGISGAIAFMYWGGDLIKVIDMPLLKEGKHNHVDAAALANEIHDVIKGHELYMAQVEAVHSMPNQGVASTFKFGRSYGTILGVLGAMDVPIRHVSPQKWKKHHDLVGKEKDASRQLAISLYPEAPLSRKKDHGRADAILISLF